MARSTVAVKFTGNASDLKSALGDVDSHMSGLGGKLAGFGKVAAVGLAGAAAGAVALGKSFYDAAIESQKVSKQTEAVIKSMGGASKITADQVGELSTKLSMQSGVDDELIQSGENVLLTFGNIRNEVGRGNDIFTRATKTALDMSVALGTDLQGANIQLGKALNDPIKGVTALQRVGVSFTAQQKDQIKTLVESGDVLGAQKLILGEVEKEFKGSAAAQATAGEKLKVVWGNLQEQLGAKLIPVVETAASFLADKLPGALDKLGSFLGPVGSQVNAFWNTLTTGFTEDEGTPIERFALKVREVVPKVQAVLQGIISWVQQNWPQIQQVIGSVMQTVGSIIEGVVTVITVLWDNFGNNILSFVQRVWPPIQQVITGVMQAIRSIIQIVTSLIQGDWSGVWNGIKGLFEGVWNAIQGIVKAALEAVRLAIGVALEIIGSVVKGALDGIVGFFASLPGRLVGALASLGSMLVNLATSAMKAWLQVHITIAQQIISFMAGLPSKFVHALGDVGHLLYDAGKKIMEGLLNGIKAGFKAVGDFVGGVAHKIASLKGPLDYDAKLLIPHGNAIMSSLLEGLQQKYGPVLDFMSGVAGDISAAVSPQSLQRLSDLIVGWLPDSVIPAGGLGNINDTLAALQKAAATGQLSSTAQDRITNLLAAYLPSSAIPGSGFQNISEAISGLQNALAGGSSSPLVSALADGVATATQPQSDQVASLLQQILAVLQSPQMLTMDAQKVGEIVRREIALIANRNGISFAA